MKKSIITLYMNQPMGKRWQQNLEAARLAEKELGSTVVIISKLSQEYLTQNNPPPCPSVVVDTTIVVRDGTISYEDLKAALCK